MTGEVAAERYLRTGATEIRSGDIIMIYTDGYEHYMTTPDFFNVFRDWDKIAERLDEFEDSHIAESSEKYGSERTLVAMQ